MENNSVKSKVELKHRAYFFALNGIKFIATLDQKDVVIQIIIKQLLRSATSIGANIVEALSGSSKRDFTNFFTHALKSANETKFWLALLRDSGKTDRQRIAPLIAEATEISNMLGSSILTLKGKK